MVLDLMKLQEILFYILHIFYIISLYYYSWQNIFHYYLHINYLVYYHLFLFFQIMCFSSIVFVHPHNNKYRYITIFSEQYHKRTVFSVDKGDLGEESVDLRTLRALRVLRPLKLVSGIPSKALLVDGSCLLMFKCSKFYVGLVHTNACTHNPNLYNHII